LHHCTFYTTAHPAFHLLKHLSPAQSLLLNLSISTALLASAPPYSSLLLNLI
jgi:hypothetical protein